MNESTVSEQSPNLFQSLIPIIVLIALLSLNVFIWGDATLDGSNQTALLLAAAVGAVITIRQGIKWELIKNQIVETIGKSMPAILILLLIGALSGTWLLSGVIPMLIYYGLDILHPSYFLVASVIISGLVALATGSSWSTIATIGVALIGIGNAMEINEAMTAGAIISGAYFGDKMSPLSDTTNLSPAMAGTDLYTHIRYMLYTTVPSLLIALLIFFFIGLSFDTEMNDEKVNLVQGAIDSTFNITPWLLIVPAFLIFIIIKKVPPIPSMLLGVLVGGLFAVIFQPDIIKETAKVAEITEQTIIVDGEEVIETEERETYRESYIEASYYAVVQSIYGDLQVVTPAEEVNDLFSTGGMAGMLLTIWLILSAMVFGGVMEAGGMLAKITRSIMNRVKSTGGLVTSTVGTCIFFNFTASDQYIAIVVPGRMYNQAYKDKGLKPEVLSRTLEDAGTLTSVLVPWNTCGATQSRVLGVSTVDYMYYAFFNIISPFITILYAYLNIKIRRIKQEPVAAGVPKNKED